MSQPTPYERQANFTAYALANPSATYNPSLLDSEFNAILTSLDETITNIGLIQRDDGQLQNGIVTLDSLDTGVYSLMGDWTPRGAWVTATNYEVGDLVTPTGGNASYVCCVANTSGASFAVDLALGYWQPISGSASATPATFTFSTNNVILGRATAGAGAGEEIACTSLARSLLDDATQDDMKATIGLGATSDPTFSDVIVDTLKVTGLTASAFVFSNATKFLTTSAAPTNGQLLIGSTGANPVVAGLTGTANQVSVTNGAGSITLALPQDIHDGATPEFSSLSLTGLNQGSVVFVGSSSVLSQDATNFVWDDTNNRLGVGTNAPSTHLHVKAASASGAGFFLENGRITASGANVGAVTLHSLQNSDNTNAASGLRLTLATGGTSAGDPELLFTVGSGNDWFIGIDNSDSDKFKIASAAGFGAGDVFTITPITNLATLAGALTIGQHVRVQSPRTITAATDTVGDTDTHLICNRAGTVTLTLPTASSYTGRALWVRTIQAQAVNSDASNVVPQTGGAAATGIIGATDGGWAVIVSDGTNWQVMACNAI